MPFFTQDHAGLDRETLSFSVYFCYLYLISNFIWSSPTMRTWGQGHTLWLIMTLELKKHHQRNLMKPQNVRNKGWFTDFSFIGWFMLLCQTYHQTVCFCCTGCGWFPVCCGLWSWKNHLCVRVHHKDIKLQSGNYPAFVSQIRYPAHWMAFNLILMQEKHE